MSTERNFLHDLIGPLSAASNLLEIFIEELSQDPAQQEHVRKLQKILNSMESANGLVAARRESLINSEERK